MKVWAKIEDGRIVYPPKNDKARGMFNVDKNEKWLTEHGYLIFLSGKYLLIALKGREDD